MILGQLETVPIRNVWKVETDFSAWLAQEENLKRLGDTIGIDILEGEAEAGVGDFRADIFAQEDGSDRRIVIEAQYGDTDHKHLGQVITYAAGTKSQILIWVVESARDEHRAAIQWLNENTPEDIVVFLIKIEVFKIGDSIPAPNFTILESPNKWLKTTHKSDEESEAAQRRHQRRYEWWSGFINYATQRPEYAKLVGKRNATRDHWMCFGTGSSRYHIELYYTKTEISISIYIPKDKELFKHFYAQKEHIEEELGFEMEWNYLENRQASRIDLVFPVNTEEITDRDKYYEWYCKHLSILKKVFPKYFD